jgi:hypothetical protein
MATNLSLVSEKGSPGGGAMTSLSTPPSSSGPPHPPIRPQKGAEGEAARGSGAPPPLRRVPFPMAVVHWDRPRSKSPPPEYLATASASNSKPSPGASGIESRPSASSFQPSAAMSST